jgi:fatty acid desaturase
LFKELPRKSKIGLGILCISIIIFIIGIISIGLFFDHRGIPTYIGDTYEKFMIYGGILIAISNIIAFFGISLITFDKKLIFQKKMKVFTVITFILSIIGIFALILLFYYGFTPIEWSLIFEIGIFLYSNMVVYAIYAIYFKIKFNQIQIIKEEEEEMVDKVLNKLPNKTNMKLNHY